LARSLVGCSYVPARGGRRRIYLGGLAQMTSIDLSTEVERTLAKNSDRIYETDARGVLNRADYTP